MNIPKTTLSEINKLKNQLNNEIELAISENKSLNNPKLLCLSQRLDILIANEYHGIVSNL